ncbi:hypothetical protein CLU79DRAFT_772399 [Phycomyces nitens]|nr:hypothetical protein CLU79DRAFT_772399 [Phycomyces nitens]
MRPIKFLSFATFMLLAIPAEAGFWDDLFGLGDKSSSIPPASSSALSSSVAHTPLETSFSELPSVPLPSVPLPSALLPSIPVPSVAPSSIIPTPTPLPSPSPSPLPSSPPPKVSPTQSSSASLSASSSASPTTAAQKDSGDSGSNKTAIIAGTVCAIVSVIFAGIGYAFFVKTRRNNREARLYAKDNTSDTDRLAAHPNVLPHSAYMAQDNGYGTHEGYSNQYDVGDTRYVPQSPMVGMQPNSQQWDGYAQSAAYNNTPQYPQSAHYYDPAYAQDYNSPGQYTDPNQYQSYVSPVPVVAATNGYSRPHAYEDQDKTLTGQPAAVPTYQQKHALDHNYRQDW